MLGPNFEKFQLKVSNFEVRDWGRVASQLYIILESAGGVHE